MKKIATVSFLLGRNAEYYLLCQNMVETITPAFAEKYGIGHVYQSYEVMVSKVAKVFLQNQQFTDTKGLNEADALSDSYMSMYKSMLKTYKNWPEKDKKEAYDVLYQISKPYWSASSKPISETLALVKDLVAALRSNEEAKAAATLLGLDPVVNNLDAANIECNKRYKARADERLVRSLADKMKDVRKQTDEAFWMLADVISALYIVNATITKDAAKDLELSAMIDGINAVILEYTVAISRRGSGPKANVDPGTNPPEGGGSSGEEERPGEL